MVAGAMQVYPTTAELVAATADRFIQIVGAAVTARGVGRVALAGGRTPRDLYQLLASEEYRDQVRWEVVHLYWGDERSVPPDHADSNYLMVKRALLDAVPIPDDNIHRIYGERSVDVAANDYAHQLHERFDLVLLGVGNDGHTASLFPGTDAPREKNRKVIPVFVPQHDSWRITLTLPIFNLARDVIFLVAGEEKAEIMREVAQQGNPTVDLPATLVRPLDGDLVWMLDAQAASLLMCS